MIASYNFLTFLPAFLVGEEMPFTFFFWFIDLSFLIVFVGALTLQTPYMPHIPSECHKANTISSGLFQALAQELTKTWKPTKDGDTGKVSKPPTARDSCKDFLSIWALEITVVYVFHLSPIHSC